MKLTALIAAGMVAATPAFAEKDPYKQTDGSRITLSGTVVEVDDDEFELNYGSGVIEVEIEDDDRHASTYVLDEGDKVTVSGIIDDDFFESTEIKADTVFVDKLNTHFFSNETDKRKRDKERMRSSEGVWWDMPDERTVSLVGTVTEVSDDEFVLDTGKRSITVEVDDLDDNPLDDEGYQKVRVGDRVRVAGEIDDDLFEGREIEADSVVSLRAGKSGKSRK